MAILLAHRGSNPYTNVVKKWLEFSRAIKREEVTGRYTERAPKSFNHHQQSMLSCQKIGMVQIH